jgi:hypothetical protein
MRAEKNIWGKLAARYHGREGEQHRLLALDGGGIRGVLTLEILLRIEQLLAGASGKEEEFRLCHFFDYIGGTSTGAIIAAGLARGMSVGQLLKFYCDSGAEMFDRQHLVKRWYSLYKSDPLRDLLQKTFGAGTTLAPDDLECLLLAVTLNRSTDSPWPISSNPQARYNDTARPDCNLRIPLWQIVRASTAAPVYFPPEVIEWDPNDVAKAFVFVDGGMTPYNNPSFLLYRMATDPAYRLEWASGEDKLLLISVGTGAAPKVEDYIFEPERGLLSQASGIPAALMYGAMVDQDINCRLVGRCLHGAIIDRELGDMIPRDEKGAPHSSCQDLGRRFLYVRYNADISPKGIEALGLSNIDAEKIARLDAVGSISDLRRIGFKASEQVCLDHFMNFLPEER